MKMKHAFWGFVLAAVLVFPALGAAQTWELLIITPVDFEDELVPLKNWKDETGRPTIIATLGDVYEKEYGEVRDEPEQIKRFIEEYVRKHGVKYVMLAGDCDKLPVRYIKAYNTEWGTKFYPSDLYYMDLYDAKGALDLWDGDGDNIIGEMDFAGGTNIAKVNLDNINMYPDVAVGRIPASTDTEISRYVAKVIDYEHLAPGTWFHDALFVLDGDDDGWGEAHKMDALATYLGGFSITKLYRDQAPYNTMTYAQCSQALATEINNGAGFVNFYGHGNRLVWDDWFTDKEMPLLTNSDEKLPVMFITACYTGRFHFERDYYLDRTGVEWNGGGTNRPEPMPVQPSKYDQKNGESMAENFLVFRDTGAVAYFGVTSKCERGAWLGTNKGLCPYFYEAYRNGAGILGNAWKAALGRFATDLKDPTTGGMYHYAFIHIHKMMFFGDPSLSLGGNASLIKPVPDIKANGQDLQLTVSPNTPVNVTVALDPGSYAGERADWWVVSLTPFGWFSYVFPINWFPGIFPCAVAPLFKLHPAVPVFNMVLPVGQYTFFFAVDDDADLIPDATYLDAVTVKVQ